MFESSEVGVPVVEANLIILSYLINPPASALYLQLPRCFRRTQVSVAKKYITSCTSVQYA